MQSSNPTAACPPPRHLPTRPESALAALGGIIFIGEPLTPRLIVATLAIIGGIALAVLTAARRKR